MLALMGYSRKTLKQRGLKTYVLVGKNPRNIDKFVTLPLECLDKTKPHQQAFHNIVLQKRVTSLKFQD